jgi:hypothetical protein
VQKKSIREEEGAEDSRRRNESTGTRRKVQEKTVHLNRCMFARRERREGQAKIAGK